MKSIVKWLCISALAAASSAWAAPYVVLPGGQQKVGTQIRAKADGTITLLTADGATLTFMKGQYVKAVADKPAEFDQARQKAAAKDYPGAEAMLKKIILDYANLEWDNNARIVLAREVYGAKGDSAAAVGVFDDLFRVSPDMKNNSDVAWAYRDALLVAKQFEKLGPSLDEVIKTGSRADAAKAQVMRGDVRMAKGEVENAVLDYLRTVVLFESESDALPEAMYKAAQALRALRDPRADQLIKDLKSKYPASEFAAKAGG